MISKKQHSLPMEEFDIAYDLYSREGVESAYDDEGIDAEEAGFTLGYLTD